MAYLFLQYALLLYSYLSIYWLYNNNLHSVSLQPFQRDFRNCCSSIFILASFTNTTTSICSTTTCIGKETPYHTTMATAEYQFEGNYIDSITNTAGIAFNGPNFISNNPYGGTQTITLSAASSQYIQISNVNLSGKSFTIEAWLYITIGSLVGDIGLFSHCDLTSKCLSISIRNARITLSFDSMKTNSTFVGSTLMPSGSWNHVAVVYDSTLYQQQIYLNGVIDVVSSGTVSPYQASSSTFVTTIGRSVSSAYGTTYFTG